MSAIPGNSITHNTGLSYQCPISSVTPKPTENALPKVSSNPSAFSSSPSTSYARPPERESTIRVLSNPVNPQRAEATGIILYDYMHESYPDLTDSITSGTGQEIAKKLIEENVPAVARYLAPEVTERLAKNVGGSVPAVGIAVAGYSAVSDGAEAVDSFKKGQYVSGALYTASSAGNAGQAGFNLASTAGLAGGALTAETGIGAVVGGVEAGVTWLGSVGTGAVSFGLGVGADYAKRKGY